MRALVILTVAFVLLGCDGSGKERIPLDTVKRAEELCSSLDGVNVIYVDTYLPNPKANFTKYRTEITVECKRHNAVISTRWQWEETYENN